MSKRIVLTRRELDVIFTMISIAGVSNGDGDYESWSDSDWKAMETLRAKAAELSYRDDLRSGKGVGHIQAPAENGLGPANGNKREK